MSDLQDSGRREPGRLDSGSADSPLQGEKMTADRDPVHAMGMRFAMEDLSEDQINVEADPYAQRSFTLAALAHLLLISMLFLGVQWVTSEPAPMQAELWGALPAAPQPPSAPPEPPRVEPKPEPKPQPKPEPKPQIKPEPPVKPDIALKEEKKKPKEEPKKPELKKEEPKKEPVKKETPKKEEPKKEEPKKEEPKKEDSKKEDLKKAEKLEQEKKREAEREKALSDLMNKDSSRVLGNINATTTGSAAAGAARDPGYADRVIGKIRSNITGSGCDIPGNPEAVFIVKQERSGYIIDVIKKRSSGFTGCDDAIERAIKKSDPLPQAKEGNYSRELELSFKPKDIK